MVNDLPGVSNLITKLFADDTCLFLTASTVSELQAIANEELKCIEYWMANNKLTINYSKTKYMIICPNKQVNVGNFNVIIDGNNIYRMGHFKYLGIQRFENFCTVCNFHNFIFFKLANITGLLQSSNAPLVFLEVFGSVISLQ